ncbi:MAG TPA: hypothetical protein VGG27_11395 [Magnetospirillaceae bacterium]|jgi:hypothetical protein
MANYICRLMDSGGNIRGVVPIIGSNEADAIQIARHHLKSNGFAASRFELWRDNIRILARGDAEGDVTTPQISGITAPPY